MVAKSHSLLKTGQLGLWDYRFHWLNYLGPPFLDCIRYYHDLLEVIEHRSQLQILQS